MLSSRPEASRTTTSNVSLGESASGDASSESLTRSATVAPGSAATASHPIDARPDAPSTGARIGAPVCTIPPSGSYTYGVTVASVALVSVRDRSTGRAGVRTTRSGASAPTCTVSGSNVSERVRWSQNADPERRTSGGASGAAARPMLTSSRGSAARTVKP